MSFISNRNNQKHFWDVVRGQIPGQTAVFIEGRNENAGSSVEGLWTASVPFTWHNTSSILNVVSDNINDNLIGTGARTIFIIGLDIDFNIISETINLNGTTNVLTTNEYLRINSVDVIEVGTYGSSNLGNITITRTDNSDIMAHIGVLALTSGVGRSAMVKYTIPKGKIGTFIYGYGNVYGSKLASMSANIRPNKNLNGPFFSSSSRLAFKGLEQNISIPIESGSLFQEKTDIWIDCLSEVVGTVEITAILQLILIDNK